MSSVVKNSKWQKPSPILWGVLLGIGVLVTIFVYGNIKAAHIEDILREEFRTIGSPPGVKLIGEESLHKPGVVFVGHTYSFTSDFNVVKAYYERELTSRGWVHNDERQSGDEIVIEYCKRQYATKIDYLLNSATPVRYTLYLDWGINNCR